MFGELYTIHMANNTEMGQNSISQIDFIVTEDVLLSAEDMFTSKSDPRTHFQCYLTQFVPSRPWSQIATNHKLRRQGFQNCRNLWMSQFVTVQNTTAQIDFIVTEGVLLSAEDMFTSKSAPFKNVSWVHRLWALKLINIHINKYTSEITPKWPKIQLLIFMSKVNLGTLPSTQNSFSVLLDLVCAVTAMITKCDKSQNATARIPELSQFVTVALCDVSKSNFSDSCP